LAVSALSLQGQRADDQPPAPARLFPFHEGGKEGRWGFINRHGKVIVPPRFIQALDFSDGLARVQTDKTLGYIDARGATAFTHPDDLRIDWSLPFTEGLAAFSAKGKCGYFDRQGKVVVAPKYDTVIRPQFAEAQKFSEGLVAVRTGEHWGYTDKQGKVVISGRFNDAEAFAGGLARVHEGGRWVITLDGPAFWSGGAWCYINPQGEKIRRCREDAVGSPPYGKEGP
jgi:hypothetical protein